MKKIIKILFLLIPSVVLLSSCEDVVQIKLDEGSKLYVIDAFVNDLREPQKIRVVTNSSYFSTTEAAAVTNAQVVLKDLTNNQQYNFTYGSNGFYIFNVLPTDTIAKVNHQYELNVTLDGVVYTALATQKRAAGLDSVEAVYQDGSTGGFGPPTDPYYLCLLWAKDKVDNVTDYYWIKTYRNDTLFSASGDINLSIDGTNGPVSGVPVDSTSFTPPIIFLGFKSYQKNNTCKVEIHSIAKETYFFFVQAGAQINNGGLFATTPENVKTNIITPTEAKTKAVGWFNMASVATKTKLVE